MSSYRVLVVDDSPFMRKIISDLISADSEFTVVATASTGAEAVMAAAEWKPDVMTMDLEMPEMNGLEALQTIMGANPLPIIMFSGISEANTRQTIAALQLGAFDFMRKPSLSAGTDMAHIGIQLLEKLKIAVQTRRRFTTSWKSGATGSDAGAVPAPSAAHHPATGELEAAASIGVPQTASPIKTGIRRAFRHVIAIGTSTGGPRALHHVITALPPDLPAPVLVVQHMPPGFTRSLAQRLDCFSSVRVTEAGEGERLEAGTVYIAPGGRHMKLGRDALGYFVSLSDEEAVSGHRPSVDVLFRSLVPHPELKRIAVILTGMGSDGAKGMKALADSGSAVTIAEAEETCVVYGMPRCAVANESARIVLPLHQIGERLLEEAKKR